jgi:hypothetical protein
MHREGMVGVNSCEEIIEAVSELRTEHHDRMISRLRRVLTVISDSV